MKKDFLSEMQPSEKVSGRLSDDPEDNFLPKTIFLA